MDSVFHGESRVRRTHRVSSAWKVVVWSAGFALIGWFAPAVYGAPVRPWVAPPKAKVVQNPVKPTPKALTVAAEVFKVNCAGCHGEHGDGNGPASVVLPRKAANFTDGKKMAEMTDG